MNKILSFPALTACVWLVMALCLSCSGGDPSTPSGSKDNVNLQYGMRYSGSVDVLCAEDIAVNNDVLYLADGPGGIKVIDITDHRNPQITTTIPTTSALRVYTYRDHIYVCDASGGLKVFSLDYPRYPVLTCEDPSEYADSAAFRDGYVYVGNYYGGFRIYNASDPGHPVVVKDFSVSRVRDITFPGKYMLVSDNPFGLAIYSMAEPGNPVCLYTDGTKYANREDIVSYGNYAIIARNDESSRISVLHMKNPGQVTLENEIWPSRFVEGITISGKYLVASLGENGVALYDLGEIPTLKPMFRLDTPNYARRAILIGNSLYIADLNQLLIYDIIDNEVAK